jgi:hypothetical protein
MNDASYEKLKQLMDQHGFRPATDEELGLIKFEKEGVTIESDGDSFPIINGTETHFAMSLTELEEYLNKL